MFHVGTSVLHMEHPEGMTQAVAAVIKGRLEATNTSLRAAAVETGIPLTTLTRRLTGTSPFSLVELASIASMFETTVSRLAIEAEALDARGAA